MESNYLTLNLLDFAHKDVELSCYLTSIQSFNTCRLSKKDVSYFVRLLKLPEETEFLYTTFEKETDGGYLVTLPTHSPSNEAGIEEQKSCWSYSFLKKYYTNSMYSYFQQLALPVKITFVGDLEVWVSDHSPYPSCNGYKVFQLRVQFNSITGRPELLVSTIGSHSVHKESLATASFQDVSSIHFKWVLFENQLFQYDNMSDEARRNDDRVFPCINNDLLKILKYKKPAPDKSNRYIRFWNEIESFKNKFLTKESFRKILLLESHEWTLVPSLRLKHSIGTQSSLLFGNGHEHTDPHSGMKNYGPKELTPDSKIVFFYICRNADKRMALTVNDFLSGYNPGFSGLRKYAKIPFSVEKGFSIYFDN